MKICNYFSLYYILCYIVGMSTSRNLELAYFKKIQLLLDYEPGLGLYMMFNHVNAHLLVL